MTTDYKNMAPTTLQVKTSLGKLTPKHRIARYLVKMARNMNNPRWRGDELVHKVLTGDVLDIKKVRAHFVERRIITGLEFDEAVMQLRADGLIEEGAFWREKTSEIEVAVDLIDIEMRDDADNRAANEDVARLMTLDKASRDVLKTQYSILAQTKIAEEEAKAFIPDAHIIPKL